MSPIIVLMAILVVEVALAKAEKQQLLGLVPMETFDICLHRQVLFAYRDRCQGMIGYLMEQWNN